MIGLPAIVVLAAVVGLPAIVVLTAVIVLRAVVGLSAVVVLRTAVGLAAIHVRPILLARPRFRTLLRRLAALLFGPGRLGARRLGTLGFCTRRLCTGRVATGRLRAGRVTPGTRDGAALALTAVVICRTALIAALVLLRQHGSRRQRQSGEDRGRCDELHG
jgi:hypothetical protein